MNNCPCGQGGVMKSNKRFISAVLCSLLSTGLLGCATVKEMGKGFLGVSTQVLEEGRKDALKKSFAIEYKDCYVKVKDILAKNMPAKNMPAKDVSTNEVLAPYIYSEDSQKKMIAIYLSQADTTPVGIFFTQESGASTLIEISSPSTYAKEEIANRIFSGLAPVSPNQKEKKADVKEKVINQ